MWFKRKASLSPWREEMRALTVANPGPQGELHEQRVGRPLPAEDEVVIRVAYAGVNRADVLQRQGRYPAPEGESPVPGLEVSGEIVEIGGAVLGWNIGEKVCALTNGGGYAEYVNVPAAQILALPASIGLKEAATLPEACATAVMALIGEATLRPEERVVLHGGASGVGMIMAQVARVMGAKVFATASTHAKRELIASLGATPLAYDPEHFAQSAMKAMGGPADVVVDTLGGAYMQQHLKLLGKGGRMVSLAFLEGAEAPLALGALLLKNIRWSGVTLRGKSPAEKARIMDVVRRQIWPQVATGQIRPRVDSCFPLENVHEAHSRMENRLNCGKIVLEVCCPEA